MKLSLGLVLGLGFAFLLSSTIFADEGMRKDKVKTLNEAAMALEQSNPDLSSSLKNFANEESKETGKEMKSEDMATRDAHVKLLKDSAAALQSSNPDLANKLTKMADKMSKKDNYDRGNQGNQKSY